MRSTTPPIDEYDRDTRPEIPGTEPGATGPRNEPPPQGTEQEPGGHAGGYPGGYPGGPGSYGYPGAHGLTGPGNTIYRGLTAPDETHRTHVGHPAWPPILPAVTEHQIAESGKFVFDMLIVDEKLASTTMAADPKMSAGTLGVKLQMKLTDIAKTTVGPLDVRVHYEEYPTRMFICAVPQCLGDHIRHLIRNNEITSTGDTLGNKYKLLFGEHDEREYKKPAQKADDRFCGSTSSPPPQTAR